MSAEWAQRPKVYAGEIMQNNGLSLVMNLYVVFLAGGLVDHQYWSVAAIDLDNVRTTAEMYVV